MRILMYVIKTLTSKIDNWSMALVCAFLLTGCYNIPQAEYAEFKAMTEDKRVMNRVKLVWDVRPDAAEYCLKAHKDRDQAFTGPPAACAMWSKSTNECTIVTGPNPTHVVLGHEVRHCFEGHFH